MGPRGNAVHLAAGCSPAWRMLLGRAYGDRLGLAPVSTAFNRSRPHAPGWMCLPLRGAGRTPLSANAGVSNCAAGVVQRRRRGLLHRCGSDFLLWSIISRIHTHMEQKSRLPASAKAQSAAR
jgi:hypothetical protein